MAKAFLPAPLFANPFMAWAEVALKTTEMLVSSGQVINTRVARMARHGANPNASDVREMHLMGSEKVKALAASGAAVARNVQTANLALAARGWQQWMASVNAMASLAGSRTVSQALSRQQHLAATLGRAQRTGDSLSHSAARLASAALAPVHAAATANARRLARPKRKTGTTRR